MSKILFIHILQNPQLWRTDWWLKNQPAEMEEGFATCTMWWCFRCQSSHLFDGKTMFPVLMYITCKFGTLYFSRNIKILWMVCSFWICILLCCYCCLQPHHQGIGKLFILSDITNNKMEVQSKSLTLCRSYLNLFCLGRKTAFFPVGI
jgi:hypothetical protein